MLNNIPTVSVKSQGASLFSEQNKKILETNIENALKEGFKSTFLFGDSEYAEDVANNFAKTAAPSISNAIDDYIKNMILSQNILITPTALISPVGPVSGAMSTMTDIQIF